jgi:hypothetical protein
VASDAKLATETSVAPASFEPPALTAVQRSVVDSLQEEGFAVVPFRELFDDALWAELDADIAPFVQRTEEMLLSGEAKATSKKDQFIVRRYLRRGEGVDRPRFTLDSPWLRVGASDVMLDVVNTYREQWTTMHYLDNWYTVPSGDDEERVASQRWHRDPEEAHVVKAFLYFSDVDEGAGPFEYIRGSATGGRYGDLWPWGTDAKSYPPQDELAQAVAPEDRLSLTGPRGTMIFCDTGGFHRGGFARTKPRILAVWSYVAPAAGLTRRFEAVLDGGATELPAKARFAVA